MKRKQIIISQSLIKEMIVQGNEVNVCPLLLWKTMISKELRQDPTDPMRKGSFFEYIALGGGAPGTEEVTTLPLVRGDKKSADQIRIEAQATVFLNAINRYEVNIEKTQVVFEKEWDNASNIWADQYEILIKGVADFQSPIKAIGIDSNNQRIPLFYDDAIHDLKLTADVNNTFGPYAWGVPYAMDHIQAAIYNYLTDLPFFYWVFDYKPKPEYKIIQKKVDSTTKMEMHESIRKVVEKIVMFEENEWDAVPYFNLCSNCIVAEVEMCEKQIDKPDIIII